VFEYRFNYRRNLPHYQPEHATLFITFRLVGSIPGVVLQELTEEYQQAAMMLQRQSESAQRDRALYLEQRRAFGKWDAALHTMDNSPRWLQDPQIAQLVADSLHYRHGQVYGLHAFCIMPNHVHMVIAPLAKADGTFHSLASIMHSLKRYTAHQANLLLGREGDFWQHESYDHVVRGVEEYWRIVAYVLNNPVKAGLVQDWQDWPWSYLSSSSAS
jgi:REP element-mobilizing transposase RayT